MEIQAAILLVIVFFLMLAFSVPVSYSIIVSALVTIVAFLTPGFGVFVSAQKMVSGIDSFSLIAVPFFILAGLLMNSGGIAKRLINLALLVLGKVPGSLALTNIAGNAMFGSISGSGIAAATAIGGVMLPLEKEQKYDEGFAAAVNIATAPVGQLIPPTTAFIVFSAAGGGASVAALFMAGWIPGLLWAACCMVVAFFYARKQGYVIKRDKLTAKNRREDNMGCNPEFISGRDYHRWYFIWKIYADRGIRCCGCIRLYPLRVYLQNDQTE